MALLQVRNLSKSFSGVKALSGAELAVETGKVHALMGENGAGKSTLMRCLAGLCFPDAGEILLKGAPIRIQNPHDAFRHGIAMIHQELLPFKNLTVAENMAVGREPTRWFPGWIDRAAMNREAALLLKRLRSEIAPGRKMGGLSIAEMQVVEIAKALAHQASVVIMDEPTSALSRREAEALFDVIRDLKRQGVAVIYISHKMDEVFRVADTITVMRDGRHRATKPARELDELQLIQWMVGRELAPAASGHGPAGGIALQIRGLSKPGKFWNVSFHIRRGEILGVAGLMGAGRTDLANAIYGLAPAIAGEIEVNGSRVAIGRPSDAIAAGIALVSEDRKEYGLVPRLSVKHNITLASIRHWLVGHSAENREADEQIRAFAIKAASRDQHVVHLSGGNQQKVVIARALLNDPDILILDEPTRGVDIGAKSEIYAIIQRLAAEGKAVLLFSSELAELFLLSHRLLVLRQGVVSAELDPRQTSQENVMKWAMPENQT